MTADPMDQRFDATTPRATTRATNPAERAGGCKATQSNATKASRPMICKRASTMALVLDCAGVVLKGWLWLAAWWFLVFHQNMSGIMILAAWTIMKMDMERIKTPFAQSGADSNHPKSITADCTTEPGKISTTEPQEIP